MQRLSAASQRAAALPPMPALEPSMWIEAPPPPAEEFKPPERCEAVPAEVLAALVQDAARREGLTSELLTAVIHQESGFVPCAVSPKGAMGLMQLMPGTAALLGVIDPFDPKENIDAGARFLKFLLDRYAGDLALALGAYNAGPKRVDETGGIPPIPETQNYVREILKRLGKQTRGPGAP